MKRLFAIYLISLILMVTSTSYCEDFLLPDDSISVNHEATSDTVQSADSHATDPVIPVSDANDPENNISSGPDTSIGTDISIDPISTPDLDPTQNVPVLNSSTDIGADTTLSPAFPDVVTAEGDIADPGTLEKIPENSDEMSSDAGIVSMAASDAAALAAVAGQKSITVSPTTYSFGTITPGSPVVVTGAAVLTIISSSATWNLSVTGANFSNGTGTIPAGRLEIKVSTSSTYTPLSTSAITLLSNQGKTSKNGTTVRIDYRITLNSSDLGGNFTGNITYSVL
jgi:uncharacterized protein YaiE (UPF0345 family)